MNPYSVSVLVSVFDVEHYIERCARSLFEQTYQALEYIFVDDASEDNSICVLERVMKDYPARAASVQIIHHETNRGLAAARNTAFDHATGEFVCVVDSDDWMEPDGIERLVAEQVATGADVVWGNALMHRENGVIELKEPRYKNLEEWRMCYFNFTRNLVMVNWRRIMRRSLLEKYHIRHEEGLDIGNDKQLMPLIAYYAKSFSSIDAVVYHYERRNTNSRTYRISHGEYELFAHTREIKSMDRVIRFLADKEAAYLETAQTARLRRLLEYRQEALRHSSRKGFRTMVKWIMDTPACYREEFGWGDHSFETRLKSNYAVSRRCSRKQSGEQIRNNMSIKKWIVEHLTFGRNYLLISQRQLMNDITSLVRNQYSAFMWNQTLHSKETGVSDKRLCDEEVVVSLTTYGDRIHTAHLAIESIMQQTVRPNRIVLWLAEDEFKEETLPVALQMQKERGLEIAYCKDIKSYKKLIPSLTRFPDACIITVDDDVVYEPDLVEKMIKAHIEHPSDICATMIHAVILRADGKPAKYMNLSRCVKQCPENNNLTFTVGVGGILYPPDCFSDEVFDQKVFMDICGSEDDVWFNAMRLLKGTRVTKVYTINPKGDFMLLPASDVSSLWEKNRQGGNDDAIQAVYSRYGLFDKLNG